MDEPPWACKEHNDWDQDYPIEILVTRTRVKQKENPCKCNDQHAYSNLRNTIFMLDDHIPKELAASSSNSRKNNKGTQSFVCF